MTEQHDDKDLQQEVNAEDHAQPENEANENITAEDKLKQELNELNDKYLRLYSEFENYKRRVSKERVELIQTAGKDILVAMLPVIDDFERALKAISSSGNTPLEEGVKLVHHKLKSTLESKGLKPIVSMGQPFDLDLHEAIANIPAPSEDMKGKVVDEVEKGYMLGDKVVRFAKVVVGE